MRRASASSVASRSARAPSTISTNSPLHAVRVAREPRLRLAERADVDGLEELGELARDHDAPRAAEHRAQVGHACRDAVRRFVEHERVRQRGERLRARGAVRPPSPAGSRRTGSAAPANPPPKAPRPRRSARESGPRRTRLRAPPRRAARPGSENAGVPASLVERHRASRCELGEDAAAPRASRCARAARSASWRCRSGSSRRAVTRVSSAAIASTLFSTSSARSVMSLRLPIGVATTYNVGRPLPAGLPMRSMLRRPRPSRCRFARVCCSRAPTIRGAPPARCHRSARRCAAVARRSRRRRTSRCCCHRLATRSRDAAEAVRAGFSPPAKKQSAARCRCALYPVTDDRSSSSRLTARRSRPARASSSGRSRATACQHARGGAHLIIVPTLALNVPERAARQPSPISTC